MSESAQRSGAGWWLPSLCAALLLTAPWSASASCEECARWAFLEEVDNGQQAPATKPDFSGTWELDPERSSLQIRPPDASTFVIEHEEPHWRLVRTHVFDGASDTLTLELTTDGEPVTSQVRGWDVESRMHWDDGTLVLDSTMRRGSQQSTVVVRYSLEEGGRTFIAEEQMESEQQTYENLWVFDKVEAAPDS